MAIEILEALGRNPNMSKMEFVTVGEGPVCGFHTEECRSVGAD